MTRQTSALILKQLRTVTARLEADAGDGELLQRFASRDDQEAFATLVRRHGGLVLRVCEHVLGRSADAEDAFQATFLILARKAGRLSGTQSLAGWLQQTAWYVARRARSAALRRQTHETRAVCRDQADPAAEISLREAQAIFDQELAQIGETYRTPLVLCLLEGKTQREAAHALAVSLATLERRLKQGRELLRARLDRRGVTLAGALLAGGLASAAAPPGLVQAALAVAAGTPSQVVASLAEQTMRGVLLTQLIAAGRLTLLLGMSLAGTAGAVPTPQPSFAPPAGSVVLSRPAPAIEARAAALPLEEPELLAPPRVVNPRDPGRAWANARGPGRGGPPGFGPPPGWPGEGRGGGPWGPPGRDWGGRPYSP